MTLSYPVPFPSFPSQEQPRCPHRPLRASLSHRQPSQPFLWSQAPDRKRLLNMIPEPQPESPSPLTIHAPHPGTNSQVPHPGSPTIHSVTNQPPIYILSLSRSLPPQPQPISPHPHPPVPTPGSGLAPSPGPSPQSLPSSLSPLSMALEALSTLRGDLTSPQLTVLRGSLAPQDKAPLSALLPPSSPAGSLKNPLLYPPRPHS